jgi:hypothetical protein
LSIQKIAVDMLEQSPRVKVRAGLDKKTVARYREVLESGGQLDEIHVFREKGTQRYLVADGSHRIEGARQAKVKELDAEIHDGDETAALKYALRCNTRHGLLRRDGDVMACIRSLMLDSSLSTQYTTHQQRAELLEMNYKTFQRHFAKWRSSPAGTKHEQAVKDEQQEKADKTTPARNKPAAKDDPPKPPSAVKPKDDPPKRESKPLTVGKPAASSRESPKETPASKRKPIAHGVAHGIKRFVSDAANCSEDPQQCVEDLGISKTAWKRAIAFFRNCAEHVD